MTAVSNARARLVVCPPEPASAAACRDSRSARSLAERAFEMATASRRLATALLTFGARVAASPKQSTASRSRPLEHAQACDRVGQLVLLLVGAKRTRFN